jgi:hypothetical protein
VRKRTERAGKGGSERQGKGGNQEGQGRKNQLSMYVRQGTEKAGKGGGGGEGREPGRSRKKRSAREGKEMNRKGREW